MSLLSQLRTDLRFSLRDTDSTNPRIADANYNRWINRGIGRIAIRSLFYERAAPLLPDGLRWVYDLIGSGVANVASDYLGLRAIKHNSYGTLDVSFLEELENYEADGLLTGETPTQAYVFRNMIAFDAIMDGTELIVDSDDRDFAAAGNWAASTAGDTFLATGGEGRLTIGATPSTSLLSLSGAAVTDLTIGRWYVLTIDMRHGGAWGGGLITVACDAGSGVSAALAVSDQTVVVKFQAVSATSTITITCASAPTAAQQFFIDDVSLQESPIVVFYYGLPPTLSADSDTPVYPLSLASFDGLIRAASILEYADDEGDAVLVEREELVFSRRLAEFVRFIENKGKQYAAQSARAHRL